MRYQQLWLAVFAFLSAFAIAAPIPSFEDIEKRWRNGESEKEIHAEHHLRDASPAWIVEHEAGVEGEFSYAPDKRTLETRRNRMLIEKRDASTGYKAMKSFVNDFMRKAGKGNVVSKRSVEVDEAPVLKPKKMMRYYFSA